MAGGRSSRMGADKALLKIGGETMVGRIAQAVKEAAGNAAIVGDPARYGMLGYPVIEDRFVGCGPLGGIHAALVHAAMHTAGDWNVIVACDMPGVHAEGIAELLRQTLRFREHDVIIPVNDGQREPLCAVYHVRAAAVIEQALLAGCYKILQALAPLRLAEFPFADQELFANVNTPDEWGALIRQ